MKKFFFISIVLLLFSFRMKPVSKMLDKYREWYSTNGTKLSVNREKKEINYQLNYIPSEVSVLGELKEVEKISKKELLEITKRYDAYEEYTIKISSSNARNFLLSQSYDKEDLTNKQYYLMSEVVKDFILINGTDSLTPLRCDFDNNFGAAPYLSLHLVFNRQKPDHPIKKKRLIYKDYLFAEDSIEYNLDHLTQLTVPKIY